MNFVEKLFEYYARQMLAKAHAVEPEITADIQQIAAEFSIKVVGLEYKFKTVESLAEKLTDRTIIGIKIFLAQGFTESEAVREYLKIQTETVNDVLRYTLVFPSEKYVFGYKQTINRLKTSDYEFKDNEVWNAWKNIGTIFDKGYRGINTTFISSQKQKFELQFHTGESFRLKTKTHELYKESRMRKTLRNRRAEIAKILIDAAKNVPVPKGVKKL